jgi:uncharacterized protein
MNINTLNESNNSSIVDILQERMVEFVQLARNNGFQAGISEAINAQLIAYTFNITDLKHLRWGLRSLLCSNQNDWNRFETLFNTYWFPVTKQLTRSESVASAPVGERKLISSGMNIAKGVASDVDQNVQGDGEDAGNGGVREGASCHENLTRSDFQFISDTDQMHQMDNLIDDLAKKMRRRMIRRQKIKLKGRNIDLRRTLRNSLRYGGIPLKLKYKQKRKNQPRLLILIDVSRSMSLYSYVFLRFAHGIVNTFRDTDAFAFHTRMVHISNALKQPNLTKVKKKLSLISSGWSGGTRIGKCFESFLNNYNHRLNSNTVVIIISDGLDTGEPQLLGRQLEIIKNRCRKLIWLNPLLGRPDYKVKTNSMLAALPYIDLFASAHNLESLCNLETEFIRV